MKHLLKAEFRKLLTVRSTYVIAIIAFLLAGFVSFWALGYKIDPRYPAIAMETAMSVATTLPVFLAIIAILLMTHEYRYNTIVYSLTSSNSRSKVLGAKVLAIGLFSLAFSLVTVVICIGLSWFGASLAHDTLAPQHFYYWDTLWRSTYYILAFVGVGLLFAVLFRHVVGAIVALLIIPSTIESLLVALVLKDNGKYLPFTSLEQVHSASLLSPPKAALIFSCYLVAGWAVAWYLFLRRDAS